LIGFSLLPEIKANLSGILTGLNDFYLTLFLRSASTRSCI